MRTVAYIYAPLFEGNALAFMRARGAKLPHLYSLLRVCFRALLPVVARLTAPQVRRALRTLPLFLDYLDQPPMFSNAETKQLLIPAGITVPQYIRAWRPLCVTTTRPEQPALGARLYQQKSERNPYAQCHTW